jgi:hypothetical protein
MIGVSVYQIIAWVAAAIVALIAIGQFALKLHQDAREFRRKQSEKAIDFVEAFFVNKKCALVVEILDYERGTWTLESGDIANVDFDVLHRALRTAGTESVSSIDKQIRSAFDEFLAKFDRLYAMLEVDLVRWPDVVKVFEYVLNLTRVERQRAILMRYAEMYHFVGALALMADTKRFPITTKAESFAKPLSDAQNDTPNGL